EGPGRGRGPRSGGGGGRRGAGGDRGAGRRLFGAAGDRGDRPAGPGGGAQGDDRRRRGAAERGRGRNRRHLDAAADPRRRLPQPDRSRGRGARRGGGEVSGLRMAISDTLVLAKRNFLRIPRAPDLLLAFTVQPIMFVLLFAYVFGGAIATQGHSYIDFLIPGILVQTMSFGGFVTALGIAEDLKKGLIDRFRSLPMSRAAVLAGRTLADIATNIIQIVVMLGVGLIIGFGFESPFLHVVFGILLLLLFGYAFSWVFAFIGL